MRPYFYNSKTKESTWDEPPTLSAEEIKQLPGAEYLKKGSEADNHPERVRASHLLVKHRDSRRPSSWREVRNMLSISSYQKISSCTG